MVPALARRCEDVEVVHLRDWEGGRWLNAPDAELLAEAARSGWTFVTYDLRTFPRLLRRWAGAGAEHAGVILVDDAIIPAHHVGGVVGALAELWRAEGKADWTHRAQFLTRRVEE